MSKLNDGDKLFYKKKGCIMVTVVNEITAGVAELQNGDSVNELPDDCEENSDPHFFGQTKIKYKKVYEKYNN